MKPITPIVAGALLVGTAGIAMAQTVVIQPEQETVIREYVVREQAEPADPPIDFDITVGSTVPDEVEVRALDVPEVETRYDYVVVEGRTVLVEPGTRRIIHVID